MSDSAMARRVMDGRLGSALCALTALVALSGCGSEPDAPTSASAEVPDYAGALPDTAGQDGDRGPESLSGAMPGTGYIPGSETPAACSDSFQACGGPLAGDWQVEGTCEPAAQHREEAQGWAVDALRLDAVACGGALHTLTSRWSGALGFADGEARDERSRTDEVGLRLSSECLVASRSELAGFTDLIEACSSLTDESAICGVAEGACYCWLERLAPPGDGGVYAVLGSSVAVGLERVEYCVEGDVLHWQQPGSGQHLVLRRVALPEAAPSPSTR